MNIARGMKFRHARVLDANDPTKHAEYEVTKVVFGVVYYKQPDEFRAKECIPIEDFPRIVMSHSVQEDLNG